MKKGKEKKKEKNRHIGDRGADFTGCRVAEFLVVCYTTMTRYVGWSVSLSIHPCNFLRCLRAFFQLMKTLFYNCPCPPARDFGSRVYALILQIAAKALTHTLSFSFFIFSHLSMYYF